MADPRSSSARMIAERLRVGAVPPSSAHPDADLLTAFAERSLSEKERVRVIEHLAHCAVCRDVVYLAQPEMEAPSPATAVPIRWFAWRRLQWAALTASLSLVVALAILVKENPDRGSVLTSRTANEAALPQTVAQSPAKNDANKSTDRYDSSHAVADEITERHESPSAAGAPERQGGSRLQTKVAEGAQQGSRGSANYEVYDKLGNLGNVKLPSDDLQKTTTFFDKEAAKQEFATSTVGEKDRYFKGADVNGKPGAQAAAGAAGASTGYYSSQQQPSGGPAANMNAQNSVQNYTTNGLYVEHNNSAPAAANQPLAAPATPAATTAADLDLKAQPKASAERGSAVGGSVAMSMARSAPTRAVVPAEDGRKKKLETIPAHATPQGTEETVAVVGKAQEVDAARAETSAAVSSPATQDLPLNGRDASLVTLTPGVASTAITDWRVRRGRLQGRLYGIWHDLILRRQPNAGDNSITEISSTSESKAEPETNIHGVTAKTGPSSVLRGLGFALQHFTSVAKSGIDVWALEVASQGRNVSGLIVHHSRDGGVTWQPIVLATQEALKPNAEADIKFKDVQQGEIVLSGGEKWQTTDGGAHWNAVK